MKTETQFTRQQYLNNECTHEQYYSQFVTPAIIRKVGQFFGEEEIRQSIDPHFNDIPLAGWDGCGNSIASMGTGISKKMKDLGDYLTQSGLVCICKNAARQIKEKP